MDRNTKMKLDKGAIVRLSLHAFGYVPIVVESDIFAVLGVGAGKGNEKVMTGCPR